MLYKYKNISKLLLSIILIIFFISCSNKNNCNIENNGVSIVTESVNITEPSTDAISNNDKIAITNIDKFKYTSLLDLYPQDTLSDDLKSIEWSEDMVFTDINLAEEYINTCIQNCQEDIGIIIPDGYTLPKCNNYEYFDKGIWSISGSRNTLGHNENKAHFIVYHLKYTTGMLVYKAYVNHDTSNLNPEQLKVYNVAIDFINNTLDKSKSIIAQEKQIFDYICKKTTYFKNETNTKQYDRYKSSIGVLLDGSANCMGYSDTFFLLCSMANMDVIYVSEITMNHAWNIITLDGKKYLVDTTFADTMYSSNNLISYEFFNASLEFVVQKYTLSENNPTLEIEPTFDDNYYFYNKEFNPYTVNSKNIYDVIASSIENEETLFEVMCEDNLPTTDQYEFIQNLSKKLSSKCNGKKIGCILQPFNNFGYVLISIT